MPSKTQSILFGAVVSMLLSTSYLSFINCLCCAGLIAGGMVAVWHYTSTHSLTVPSGAGAGMGAIAAVLGAFMAIFVNFILIKMGIRADQAIIQWMIDAMGQNMPPEQLDQMEDQMTAEVSFGGHFINGLITVVMGAIFGAVGGAIGASVFKKGPVPDMADDVF